MAMVRSPAARPPRARAISDAPRARAAQLRHHLQSFLAGGVAALAFGYYRVHQDVWRAAEAVDSRLDSLGRETVGSHAALQARVVALETEVQRLRSTGGGSSSDRATGP